MYAHDCYSHDGMSYFLCSLFKVVMADWHSCIVVFCSLVFRVYPLASVLSLDHHHHLVPCRLLISVDIIPIPRLPFSLTAALILCDRYWSKPVYMCSHEIIVHVGQFLPAVYWFTLASIVIRPGICGSGSVTIVSPEHKSPLGF